ncbi:hypothetical protein WICPIJ_000908 [Wickerhamomyces pijperi]|uniref:Protein kinase domain-containing protein n=1 Tax=Wickerhamomyces pijperi TaxID=599730 RepID=A0A9P8QEZ4_WICPI|nr:hypothetical protein WICPIJ_000908 [Wickerhamomyces pijperi]
MSSLSLNNNRKRQKLNMPFPLNNDQYHRDMSLVIVENHEENLTPLQDRESSSDSVIFIRENDLTKSFTNVIPPPSEPIQVGATKRRTNSLPQLPLSQIGYTRVAQRYKVGEVVPNFIPANYTTSPVKSRNSSTASSSDNYMSSYNSSSSSSTPPKEVTDENGFYIANPGDYFANNRFKILGILGQGTFGKVIKALDLETDETVAIKIIRAIPKYREASKIELRILTALKNADPGNKNHCIHLREVLDYENHICIITDLLDISLYEFLVKNKFKPFPGSQIQAISRQLVRSIAFLHDLNLIHTDLKPENILLTNSSFSKFKRNSYRVLKDPLINIIDFGSAIFSDEYHSELVSTRHYRAPEIVLGIGWSFECDLWSLGCILVELVTGEALFNTHENAEHMKIMELLLERPVPSHMVSRCPNDAVKKLFMVNTNVMKYKLNYPNKSSPQKSLDLLKTIKPLDQLISSKIGINIRHSCSVKENYESLNEKRFDMETICFWWHFADLVYSLLKFDPKERSSALQVLANHHWWDYGIIDEATSSMV